MTSTSIYERIPISLAAWYPKYKKKEAVRMTASFDDLSEPGGQIDNPGVLGFFR